jgi:hypothetical protein
MHLRSAPWHRSLLWLDQLAGNDESVTSVAVPVERAETDAACRSISGGAGAVARTIPSGGVVDDVEGYSHEKSPRSYGKSVSFSKSQLMRAHLRLRA